MPERPDTANSASAATPPPTKPSSLPSRLTSTQSSTSASTSSSGTISSTITSPQPGAPSAPPHATRRTPAGTRAKPTLEKWEEEPSPGLQPALQQSITITQDTTTDPVSYRVTAGGDLVLWLKPLFLRDPDPGEGDFIIGVDELEDFARCVWRRL
ncbi:hypothetical protein C8A05DRAFT_17157 [Staphylotrichum tortipilum]|uniref:Uncharacterized protein n=1 Tax=Staphylotrichum tortipilum TaxID=2831512 RepID=A0AAN6MGN6_9PEZI|nr:hypothetical protein C8A05DRAFT_17157 [Staphylotrichum longicolle]